jgi:DNA primase
MNVLDLASKRVQLRKASGTNGGEWQGPCPDCGGTDRFHVWPLQNEGKGGYWCRGCGRTGDNIQFLRDFEGLSFPEACARLNISVPERPESRPHTPKGKPEFVPDSHRPPADLWQEKAGKFITWAQENLAQNGEVLGWLAKRGIGAEASVDFRLGWNPEDLYRPRKAWGLPEVLRDEGRPKALWVPQGLVIPYVIGEVINRIRVRRPEGEPRYYVIPGSSMATMVISPARRAFVIVESELDAIAIAARKSLLYGVVALGSASAKPDAGTCEVLGKALKLLNALDYDSPGLTAMKWWGEQFKRCVPWPVPKGKDPGEAFQMGIDLDEWIVAGLPPALTIAPPVRERPRPTQAVPLEPGMEPPRDLAPEVRELWELLRQNPSVKITNTFEHYTVMRGGKYVGGRINFLLYRVPVVIDYIANHPAEEIDGTNLIYG